MAVGSQRLLFEGNCLGDKETLVESGSGPEAADGGRDPTDSEPEASTENIRSSSSRQCLFTGLMQFLGEFCELAMNFDFCWHFSASFFILSRISLLKLSSL